MSWNSYICSVFLFNERNAVYCLVEKRNELIWECNATHHCAFQIELACWNLDWTPLKQSKISFVFAYKFMYCCYRCDRAESNVGRCWRQEISREWSFPQAQRCCERSRDLCFSSTAASEQKAKTQVGQAFFFNSFHLCVLLLDWTWKYKNPEVSQPANFFQCFLSLVLWLIER